LAFAAPIERIDDEFPPKRASKKSSRANHGRKPMGKLFDHYKPELHYMRGPGPKWLAKHGRIGPTGQIAGDVDSKASKLVEAVAGRRVGCRRPRRWMLRSKVEE
jgi:hypothetical protein